MELPEVPADADEVGFTAAKPVVAVEVDTVATATVKGCEAEVGAVSSAS